ncbi:uncharacterized protein A1O9_01488 [Exophiala aquamarina CBS 119918]|uniref:USP domain-containing protein n=1 Tax=Exophiala aquamarina CBS 119918 TaxID=1182545 RepID=A0A072Q6F8_9EURO|nr:uncharacterized protein A1O9_01488 [Exophiala aquamarina CBS 119918]KEF63510.1 hypothetical protein A1O9_01488 [Exophiala aquamarina CBS 119918]
MSDPQQLSSNTAPSIPSRDTNGSLDRQHLTPPIPSCPSNPATAIVSPTSKVTINTRPLSSQSITQPVAGIDVPGMPTSQPSPTSEGPTICGEASEGAISASATITTTTEPADVLETISISSSPSKSPEIEIAEIEDYDQDPAQTKWTSKIGGASAASTLRTVQPGHVYRSFPFAHETTPGNVSRIVQRIAERFQHGGPQDGDLFARVKDWMIDFVDICHDFPARLIDDDREFWAALPDLIGGLLRRDSAPPAQARTEDLANFFTAFAQITTMLIDYDTRNIQLLADNIDPSPLRNLTLISAPYLQPLSWVFQFRVPFYEALRHSLQFDIAYFHAHLLDRTVDPVGVGLLSSVSKLLSELGPILVKRQDFFRPFLNILNLTQHIMGPINCINHQMPDVQYPPIAQLDNLRDSSAEIILKADNILQQAIVKQLPWLNLETAGKLIEQLNPLVAAIAVEVPQIGQDIISTAGVGFADSDLTDLPSTMPCAWKFKTLRKFVTNGRMELRVMGIEVMSTDLIQVYKDNIEGRPTAVTMANPLVRFLINFIVENQLVEYIVGVDSHPQVIRRSHNVVGFLCVSGTYTNSNTDDIWKTIVESHDTRTVHEVFNLLFMCFNVYDLPALYYICQKLLELPFQQYDQHVVGFTVNLFTSVRQRVGTPHFNTDFATNPVTRQLCIRLLREATVHENLALEQAITIRREFTQQLTILLTLGRPDSSLLSIEEDERRAIMSEAAARIKAHHRGVGGDLYTLNAMISLMSRDSIPNLVENLNLTALLVAEFVHLRDQYQLLSQQRECISSFEVIYDIIATTLYHFIHWLPDTFSADLVEMVWKSYFTSPELPPTIRARSWETLTHALRLKQPRDENIVLDLIIDKHLQSLGPADYCDRLLEFIRMSVSYTIRCSPHVLTDTDDVVVIPGIERLWKIVLEAPPNTIENEAADFIIRQYLDHSLITRQTKATIDLTHSSLVDRCVRQVIASASKLKSYTDGTLSGEDEPMVIIASEDEIRAEELRFDRSLLFLRKFLEGMKSRPRYSPTPTRTPGLPEFSERKGQNIELSIQIHGSKYVTEQIQKIQVGSENTCDEFYKYLTDSSGFTQFSVFNQGQKTIIEGSNTTLAETKLPHGLIMVMKTANTPENVPARSARATSPVDNKIMHHFDDLYDLLDADERLSREVYGFLSLFSAQTEVVRLIRSMERSPAELLPPGKPFKLLYCARALRSCIEVDSFSSNPDTKFLTYSIRTIVATLPELELTNTSDPLQISIVHGLVEALLLAFRAKVSSEVSLEYLEDRKEFVAQISRLLRFTLDCRSTTDEELSTCVMVKLILESFIEACLHDDRVWNCVATDGNLQHLVFTAFVQDPRFEVRHSLLEVVIGLTGAAGNKLHLKINNPRAPRSRFPVSVIDSCLMHLWDALADVLPQACLQPKHCAEMCETMLSIMKRVGKAFGVDSLRHFFSEWSRILLRHTHIEVVGQPLGDHVVVCLTKLLFECSKLLKVANALPSSAELIEELITLFLFPPLSDTGLVAEDTTNLPILDVTVRESLYNLVLVLCQGPEDTSAVISKLNDDLLPQDFFEPIYSHDRQSLRTEVGYAGLRNLSNTCYLNSLFAQLFMNVQFRGIFLNSDSLDLSKQNLVSELAKVFAFMQNSYEKSIDPSGAVEAITTYDGEQIDVSIQMDVDEFFNLLFDRLEGQIDGPARELFKSIYGGQLVQQVKSKECEHISERLEPFSAVQVEIKGKARLEDSLRAYVEGEVLQGENKYSCTSCGRHVDAVKRACLKDVPDHLIFNLKRFDYDIMTGMRAKVNDEFQFPDTLDIAPYTLARLSDDVQDDEPDTFQLTGVIVHSGTADSGHYYSYIRQRPSVKAIQDSWVQFNDQDVTVFDLSQMREQCFGGNSDTFYNLPKFYSAYMLFYQRTSSIQKVEQQFHDQDSVNPVRLPLPFHMEQHLAQHNELYLRSYCAQDGTHAKFVLLLLERMKIGHDNDCSEDHAMESNTIEMVLEYVRQISSRWKDMPYLEETLKAVQNYVDQCTGCARTVAHWFTGTRILDDVIVRSPYQNVRKSFSYLFSDVFQRLHTIKATTVLDSVEHQQFQEEYEEWLQACVGQMAKLWDIAMKTSRCWAEYFGTLSNIIKLGDTELAYVLDQEYIEKCIELVMVHLNNPADFPISKKLKARYAVYLAARDRNRPFNHNVHFRFLISILLRVDFHLLPEGDDRAVSPKKIGLTANELDCLGLGKIPPRLEWLVRLMSSGINSNAIDSLVAHLAADRKLAGSVAEVIIKGLNDRIVNTAVNFLSPTIVFCENCRFEAQIIDLVHPALESIRTVGIDYSKDYLEFVESLLRAENSAIEADIGFLEESVLQAISHWAPTFLVSTNDSQMNIRDATVDLLRRILFVPLQQAETEDARLYTSLRAVCQELAYSCQNFVQRMFLAPRGREGATLHPGQANQVLDVMEHCLQYFSIDNVLEEAKMAEINNTITQLKFKAESTIETLSPAEWQENSSELAELSAEEYEEINSP